jgi:hypothetical protein
MTDRPRRPAEDAAKHLYDIAALCAQEEAERADRRLQGWLRRREASAST